VPPRNLLQDVLALEKGRRIALATSILAENSSNRSATSFPLYLSEAATMFSGSETEPPLGRANPVPQVPQPVKTFDSGTVDGNSYGALSGFETKERSSNQAINPSSTVPPERRRRVIIVGAGVSGVQQATVLLKDGLVKHEEIQIFDALDGYGGVWQKNKYPGCACDVPAMIYTTSYHICKSES
jgi:hypothetical protein